MDKNDKKKLNGFVPVVGVGKKKRDMGGLGNLVNAYRQSLATLSGDGNLMTPRTLSKSDTDN